jgi:DNA-binding NarL/FixJ family response regulator
VLWRRRKRRDSIPPTVLVVDDEMHVHLDVGRILEKCDPPFRVIATSDKDHCLELVTSEPTLCAVLVDLFLLEPTGLTNPELGLSLVETIRKVRPAISCAILTGTSEMQYVNEAVRLGVTYLCKWELQKYLLHYAHRILVSDIVPDERLRRVVEQLASQHDLKLRESQIVSLALTGLSRKQWPDRLGIKETTIKWYVRSVLDRVGCDSIRDLCEGLRHAANTP